MEAAEGGVHTIHVFLIFLTVGVDLYNMYQYSYIYDALNAFNKPGY